MGMDFLPQPQGVRNAIENVGYSKAGASPSPELGSFEERKPVAVPLV